MKDWTLNVTEYFTSIQGEGPTVGVPTHFLRLAGCAIRCKWCDSRYSWEKGTPYTYSQLQSVFENLNIQYPSVKHIVITGGEPLEQDLAPLLKLCTSYYWTIELETNGVPYLPNLKERLSPEISHYNVSPKLLSTKLISQYQADISTFFDYPAIFKFVVKDEKEMISTMQFITDCHIPLNRVYIMPNATSRKELQKRSGPIVDLAIKYGVNFTSRLHITIWNKKRRV